MGFGQQFFLQTRIFRQHYRCILHDSRGCGLSGKPEADIYDTKTYAADLHTILQALGVRKAVILATPSVARSRCNTILTTRMKSLGLCVSAHIRLVPNWLLPKSKCYSSTRLFREGAQFLKPLSLMRSFANINPYGADIEAMLQREACKPPIYASKATCRGFFRLDFTERLPTVRVPALIICGDTDKPVPLETASRVLAERIPDAQLVTVKDTGHFPHMEKPEIVNEAMWQWLEEKIK